MNKTLHLLSIIIVTFSSHSQNPNNNPDFKHKKGEINSKKIISKIVELDKIVNGFGPAGNRSVSIGSRDLINEQELKGYPQMSNLPDSLKNIKEYCFILNDFQFYYQNYRQGIYSKEFFFKKAKGNGRKLKDTILLTDKKVKNTISIIAGYTSDNTIVYIVDSNNNNDYSDDEPKSLLFNLINQDDVVRNSQNVDIEYFDGESIKKGTQLIMVGNSIDSNDDISLSFKFPQYRYGKVEFNNESYLIIAESFSFRQSIYFIKDQPYFDRLDQKHMIKPSQYLNIEDTYVQYAPIAQDQSKIKLTISTNEQDNKTIPIANQVGMFAPNITGINILNNVKISLKAFKGKYVFLDFWSTACPPCIQEFPKIKEVYDKFSSKEIEIIGIVDVRGKKDIKEFIINKNVTWPNIDEENPATIMDGYNIKSWPTTYLIDPNGKIIATNMRGDDLNNKLELLNLTKK